MNATLDLKFDVESVSVRKGSFLDVYTGMFCLGTRLKKSRLLINYSHKLYATYLIERFTINVLGAEFTGVHHVLFDYEDDIHVTFDEEGDLIELDDNVNSAYCGYCQNPA